MKSTPATGCSLSIALAACLLVACGAEDVEHAPGQAEPSGGVRGGPIAGRLEVFAIDAANDAAVSGAEIWLGQGAEATLAGTTDDSGRVVVESETLSGAQVVSARAAGHVSVSWHGVARDRVTLPLPRSEDTPSVTIQATIEGWESLPAPAAGKRRVARLAAAHPLSLESLDGPSCALPGGDSCVTDATTSSCTLSIRAPATTTRLLAVIAEGDDTALEAVGLAELEGPDLGTAKSVHALQIRALDSITSATVTPGASPTAVFVIGVPGLAVDGQVTLFPCFEPALERHAIPVGGDGGSLWAMGAASFTDGSSVSFERGLALPGAPSAEPLSLAPPPFLELPNVDDSAGVAIVRSPEAELHTLHLGAAGERLDVVVLDERTEVRPPAALAVAGTAEWVVTAVDTPLDFGDFAWKDVIATATRRAYRRR